MTDTPTPATIVIDGRINAMGITNALGDQIASLPQFSNDELSLFKGRLWWHLHHQALVEQYEEEDASARMRYVVQEKPLIELATRLMYISPVISQLPDDLQKARLALWNANRMNAAAYAEGNYNDQIKADSEARVRRAEMEAAVNANEDWFATTHMSEHPACPWRPNSGSKIYGDLFPEESVQRNRGFGDYTDTIRNFSVGGGTKISLYSLFLVGVLGTNIQAVSQYRVSDFLRREAQEAQDYLNAIEDGKVAASIVAADAEQVSLVDAERDDNPIDDPFEDPFDDAEIDHDEAAVEAESLEAEEVEPEDE